MRAVGQPERSGELEQWLDAFVLAAVHWAAVPADASVLRELLFDHRSKLTTCFDVGLQADDELDGPIRWTHAVDFRFADGERGRNAEVAGAAGGSGQGCHAVVPD